MLFLGRSRERYMYTIQLLNVNHIKLTLIYYIYAFVLDDISSHPWGSDVGWSGPEPLYYNSFDNLNGFVLMEGDQPSSLSPILGKVLIYN